MATEGCGCCAGLLEGLSRPCDGCLDALRRGDRLGHPHELSALQRAVAEDDPRGGGIDLVSGLVAVDPKTGERSLIGYIEDGGESALRDQAERN